MSEIKYTGCPLVVIPVADPEGELHHAHKKGGEDQFVISSRWRADQDHAHRTIGRTLLGPLTGARIRQLSIVDLSSDHDRGEKVPTSAAILRDYLLSKSNVVKIDLEAADPEGAGHQAILDYITKLTVNSQAAIALIDVSLVQSWTTQQQSVLARDLLDPYLNLFEHGVNPFLLPDPAS